MKANLQLATTGQFGSVAQEKRKVVTSIHLFLNLASRQGWSFSLFQELDTHCILILYYLKTTFLPIETMFRAHNLLDSLKGPIPDLH